MSRNPGKGGDADADESRDVPPPRETTVLFGHQTAEQAFLSSYRSGRIPHSWLIGGEAGMGKATLAYRMARFVLANPDPSAPAVREAASLALDPAHPAVRRIAGNAHTDLLVLERVAGESGALRTVITVDQVRRTVSFFGSTAGEGGWRVCIVDAADELKAPEAANALLKMLEEPPARSLFLLVSHAPGRLLPTIRSRCRRLTLAPLSTADVLAAATAALGPDSDTATLAAAAEASGGSVARALALAGGAELALRREVEAMLAALPSTDPNALHALGDRLDRDRTLLEAFVNAVRDFLRRRLDTEVARAAPDKARLVTTADLWDALNRQARDVEIYNLERKPLVFATFARLADATRG